MEIYRQLGVRPLINAATTYTKLGGSVMAPEVAQAMADAVGCFINLEELQNAVGKRLAEVTQNDAAYVSSGAAAGMTLATAACVTGDDPALMARLPNDLDGMKNEVIIHRAHRNWYDIAVRQVGVKLVEIGHTETSPWELDAAISERTAAVVYFAGKHFQKTLTLPLPFVIERAHARGIPVIVDAAAQVPPVSNLWYFTKELGADVAVFSGGKAMAGPQNTGLIVGKEPLIRAAQLNGPPVQRIGRGFKVSKESMIGLMTAVERYVARDHAAEHAVWSEIVDDWHASWYESAAPGIEVSRQESDDTGAAIPRMHVRFTPHAPYDRDCFVALLQAGDPGIEVVLADPTSVALSPHMLRTGEAAIVERRVATLLSDVRAGIPS